MQYELTDETDVKGRERISSSVEEFFSKRRVLITLTVVPVFALLCFVLVFPILWTIAASFHSVPLFSQNWQWVGLSNFQELLFNSRVHSSFYRGLLFAGGTVTVQLLIGMGIALLVAGDFKFKKTVRSIVFLPYLIPTAMLGYMAQWMFDSRYGIINSLISDYTPFEPLAWFGNPDIALWSLVGLSSWKFSIFVTIMVLARRLSIPDNYYEAAEMAGATTWQKFRDITLPNLKGVIFIVLLLRGVWMFNSFDLIWIMTRGGPGTPGATETAPIYAYQIGFQTQQLGKAAAFALLLFLVLIMAAILYFRYINPEEEVNV